MDFPRVLADEEMLSRPSLRKRVRPSSDEWNGLSECKKSFGKKHGTEFKDLPRDLAEEVLSRVPVTSLIRVRSTCKTWNTLSTSKSFTEKHLALELEREFNTVLIWMDYKIYMMSISLEESCIIKPRGKLIHSDPIDVSRIYYCDDGLLLCVCGLDKTKVVVWNSYSGHTRWIDPTPSLHYLSLYSYALGYDRSTKSHKILRFVDYYAQVDFNIYDLNSGSVSGSWRDLDFGPSKFWGIEYHCNRGVSLKGNTYWLATDKANHDDIFLVCFDFTTETFGPPLSLPHQLECCYEDILILSTVRGEQLVLLCQQWDTLNMEIFITSKIEPNAVSWSNKVFLQVNTRPLTGFGFRNYATFFIDQEKKVAVVFDKGRDPHLHGLDTTRNAAFILGVDGSIKQVDLGESPQRNWSPQLVPYAPTLLQLIN